MAERLAADVVARPGTGVPAGVSPAAFLVTVVAERQARDARWVLGRPSGEVGGGAPPTATHVASAGGSRTGPGIRARGEAASPGVWGGGGRARWQAGAGRGAAGVSDGIRAAGVSRRQLRGASGGQVGPERAQDTVRERRREVFRGLRVRFRGRRERHRLRCAQCGVRRCRGR